MATTTASTAMRMWDYSLPVARTASEKRVQQRMMYSATLRRPYTFAATYQPNALHPRLLHIMPPNSALASVVGRKYLTTLVSRDRLLDHHDAVRHVGVATTLQLTLDALQDSLCQCAVQQAVAGHSDITAAAIGVPQPRAKITAFAERFEFACETLQKTLWSQRPANYEPNPQESPKLKQVWDNTVGTAGDGDVPKAFELILMSRMINIQRALEYCLQHPTTSVLVFDGSSQQYYALQAHCSSATLSGAMRELEDSGTTLMDRLYEYEQQVLAHNAAVGDEEGDEEAVFDSAGDYSAMLSEIESYLECLVLVHRNVQLALHFIVHWNKSLGDEQEQQQQEHRQHPLYGGHEVWHFLQWVRDRLMQFKPIDQERWKLADADGDAVFPNEFDGAKNSLASANARYAQLTAGTLEFLLPRALEQADRWCVADKAPVQCERLSSGANRMQFERITKLPSVNTNVLQHLTHTLKAPQFVQEFQRAVHPPLSRVDSRSRDDGPTALDGGPALWELQWQALTHVYEDVLRQFVAELVSIAAEEHDNDEEEEEGRESMEEEEEDQAEEGRKTKSTAAIATTKKTRKAVLENQLETLETLMCAALVKSGLFDAKAMSSTRIEPLSSTRTNDNGDMDAFFTGSAVRFGPLHVMTHDDEKDEDRQLRSLAHLLIPFDKTAPRNRAVLVQELRQLVHDANVRLYTHAQSLGTEPCVQWRHTTRDERRNTQAALHPVLREHAHTFDQHQQQQQHHTTYGSTQPMLVHDMYEQQYQHCVVRSSGDVNHNTLVPVFLSYFVALRNMLNALGRAAVSRGKPLDVAAHWHELSRLEVECPGTMIDHWRSINGGSSAIRRPHTDGVSNIARASLLYAARDGVFDAQSMWCKQMVEHHRQLRVCQRDLVALLNQAVVRRAAYL